MIKKILRLQAEQQELERQQRSESGADLGEVIGSSLTDAATEVLSEAEKRYQESEHRELEREKQAGEKIRSSWQERHEEYTIDMRSLMLARLPKDAEEFAIRTNLDGPKSLKEILQRVKDFPRISHQDIKKLLHLGILRSSSKTYEEGQMKTFQRRIAASNRSWEAHLKRKEEQQEVRSEARKIGRDRWKRQEKKAVIMYRKVKETQQENQSYPDENNKYKHRQINEKYIRQHMYRERIHAQYQNLMRQELSHSPPRKTLEQPIQISKSNPISLRRTHSQIQARPLYPTLPHPEKRLAWTSTLGYGRDIEALKKAIERPTAWSASKLKNQLLHFVVTSVPGLPPSDEQLVHTAQHVMSRCGINVDSHAIQIYIHDDKAGHRHAHVILNRVRTDGAYYDCHPTALAMACHLEGSLMNKKSNFDFQLDPIVPKGPTQSAIWKKLISDSMQSYYRKKGVSTETLPITGIKCATRMMEIEDFEVEMPVGLVKAQYLRGHQFNIMHYAT